MGTVPGSGSYGRKHRCAEWLLVPFTTTLTAASGMPLSSLMVQVTVIEFCPNR